MIQNLSIEFSEIIRAKIPGLKIGILSCSKFEVRKKSDFVSQQLENLENLKIYF